MTCVTSRLGACFSASLVAAALLAACGDDDTATGSGGAATSHTASTSATGNLDTTSSAVGGAAASSPTSGSGAGGSGAGGADGAGGDGVGASGSGGGDWTLAFDAIDLPDELNLVTDMRFIPGTGDELLVLEKGGRVSHLRLDGDDVTRLGELVVETYDEQDCGLISLAFGPDFEETGDLYLGLCESKLASRVDRVHFDPSDYAAIADSAETIIRLEEPEAAHPWHNVGSIGFDPDGTLWILAGDKTVGENAQDLTSNLGKLLRVVPYAIGDGCEPAPDNPFVDEEGAPTLVYALGLRSPWRGTRDRFGRYWIGDVGLDTWEEVNVALEPGTNFGWPANEGPCSESDESCTDPVTYYGRGNDPYVLDDPDHFDAGTRSVWVGPYLDPVEGDPYGGKLDDHLLFGDLHTGFVRMLHIGEGRQVLEDRPVAHLAHGMAWDRGPGSYLYVMTFGTLLSTDTTTSAFYRVQVE